MTERLKYYLLNWFEFEIVKPAMIDTMDDADDEKLELSLSDLDTLDLLITELDDEEVNLLGAITWWVAKSGYSLDYIKSLKDELVNF